MLNIALWECNIVFKKSRSSGTPPREFPSRVSLTSPSSLTSCGMKSAHVGIGSLAPSNIAPVADVETPPHVCKGVRRSHAQPTAVPRCAERHRAVR